MKPPHVIVGTIHSVKGGEAENVVVFPDLSPAGWEQFTEPGWHGAEAMRRLFYVAATRTRNALVWCAAESWQSFELNFGSTRTHPDLKLIGGRR